jgi:hypothetical protein
LSVDLAVSMDPERFIGTGKADTEEAVRAGRPLMARTGLALAAAALTGGIYLLARPRSRSGAPPGGGLAAWAPTDAFLAALAGLLGLLLAVALLAPAAPLGP